MVLGKRVSKSWKGAFSLVVFSHPAKRTVLLENITDLIQFLFAVLELGSS